MALNSFQQAVIDSGGKGKLVVEACPGSGKTTTFKFLAVSLIKSGVIPDRIVCFTFTNKGAGEMRGRLAAELLPGLTDIEIAFLEDPGDKARATALEELTKIPAQTWIASDPLRKWIAGNITTIHAFCLRTLKNVFGQEAKVIDGAEVYSDGRKQRASWLADSIIKDGITELDWDASPNAVYYWIGQAINALVEPPASERFFADRLAERAGPVWVAGNLAELYKRYYGFCKQHGLVDFDMMQARLLYLIRNSREARETLSALYDYVIVDEAQDTDPVPQCEIIWSLVRADSNLIFIGDVDQSVYGFRDAEPEVMRSQFEARWPDVTRHNLPVNYRSTRNIIKTSAGLIVDNYVGIEQYLKPFQARDDAPDGDPVEYVEASRFDGLTDEVTIAVKENPGAWFILSRTRAECAAIHTALIASGVPAINKSGGLLFGAAHVRKALAYAKLVCNHSGARDDKNILYEIANVASADFKAPMTRRRHLPTCHEDRPWKNCGCPIVLEEGNDYSHARYYGQKAIDQAGGTWAGVVRQQDEVNRGGYQSLNSKGAIDLVRFVTKVEKFTGDARAALNAIIQGCVLPWLKAEEGIDDEDLAENGKSEDFDLLLNLTEPDQTLEQYLDRVEELSRGGLEGDESESALVGTIHWSKGAERPCVFVNSTRLPIIPPATKPGALPTTLPPTEEEERRLLFVAITRAKDRCIIGGALEWNGQDVGRSEFVQTLIDRGLVKFEEDETPSPENDNGIDTCPDCGGTNIETNENGIAVCADCKAVTWDEPEEEHTTQEHVTEFVGNILDEFPKNGRLEGGICRYSAHDFVNAFPQDWTPWLNNGQLILEKTIAGDVSVAVYTGINVGEIAGPKGEDSIRVVLREGDHYRKDGKWITRTYPTRIWVDKGWGYQDAVQHIATQKVLPKVSELTADVRICECGGAQVRLVTKKGENAGRKFWACRKCKKFGGWAE